MSSSNVAPILLILGAGGRVGAAVARLFASKGYKVAVSARTEKPEFAKGPSPPLFVQSDLSQPESVGKVFETVREKLGGWPGVVVYNAGAVTGTPADDPLSVSIENWNKDLTINTTSLFVALKEAKKGWEGLPEGVKKAFIFTGNALNEGPLGPMVTLGVGKSASAHLIQSCNLAYKGKGLRFYYADQRTAESRPVYGDVDGEAHAEMYWKLAEAEEGEKIKAWQVTFVKGLGYKEFEKPFKP